MSFALPPNDVDGRRIIEPTFGRIEKYGHQFGNGRCGLCGAHLWTATEGAGWTNAWICEARNSYDMVAKECPPSRRLYREFCG